MHTDQPPAMALPDVFPLREGLRFHSRNDGKGRFVVEDTQRNKYFRIGRLEQKFVQALMETQSAAQAFEQCVANRDETLSQENAIALCKWLAVNGLAHPDGPAGTAQGPQPKQGLIAQAFFWRARLLNPDRLLNALVQSFGWLFSPQAMIVGVVIFLAGLAQTSGSWSEFAQSYENLFSSWRWLMMMVTWCVLKVIHEVAHGATCRRYGGEVTEAGIAMILFVPIAFVNVTSSWRFASRWQRLHVTLAGVAAELFVAGVALIAWHMLDSLPLKQAAADIVLMASVSSLLFNLNPLLKFDGYFAVADASGVDNLYSYGQRYARYFGSRYILGLNANPPQLPGKRVGWIKFYGVASALYRVFTVSGLIIGAAALLHGAGLIVAMGGVVAFVFKPLAALAKHLMELRASESLQTRRLALRFGCIALLAGSPLWLIPGQLSWTAPAIVEYDPPTVLRNRSAGFVDQIHVTDGQIVVAGQPIITLRNDELRLRLFSLKRQLASVRQETLAARWRGQSQELADALAREAGLEEQVAELSADVDALAICAPCDGTIVSRRLALILETYLQAGEEIGVVGREDSKRLRVSISQNDARDADQWSDSPLKVVVSGRESWLAPLDHLETRATTEPPAPSLLASNGGPLAAIQLSDSEVTLCESRVNGFIRLSPRQSQPLRCGQRAYVKLGSTQSLGTIAVDYLTEKLSLQWL